MVRKLLHVISKDLLIKDGETTYPNERMADHYKLVLEWWRLARPDKEGFVTLRRLVGVLKTKNLCHTEQEFEEAVRELFKKKVNKDKVDNSLYMRLMMLPIMKAALQNVYSFIDKSNLISASKSLSL